MARGLVVLCCVLGLLAVATAPSRAELVADAAADDAQLAVAADAEDQAQEDAAADTDAALEAEVEAAAAAEVEAAAEGEADAEAEAEAVVEAEAEAAAETEAETEAAALRRPSIHDTPAALHRLAPFVEVPQHSELHEPAAGYGHGGFMGFAGAFVGDQQWMTILKTLMPDVHTELLTKTSIVGLIKGMENNPVGAAYGFKWYRDRAHPLIRQPFEWDSFFAPTATVANPMVELMLVAHGKPKELFLESTWKSNAYGAVERTAQTDFGGVTAARWRDLFVNALRLAADPTANPAAPVSWAQFNAVFPGGSFQVVLDVKTGIHLATPAFLTRVVAEWKARGVTVRGVGTFNRNQHAGVAAATGGQAAEVLFFHGLQSRPVPVVAQPQLFEVYARNPQELAHKTVYFNGGFLIRYQRTGINYLGFGRNTKTESYAIDEDALETLREITAKVPSVVIGIYVQEYDIDVEALAILNCVVSRNPAVFKAGFAWGGKSDAYYAAIQSTVTDATVGTNGQILFAKVNYN